MRRCGTATLCICLALLAAGCPKHGKTEYSQGRKAEEISDYDAALTYYQQALRADPNNANLKIKVNQIRFEASNFHIKQGLEMRKKGDLQAALAEFQRTGVVDPSRSVAEQELGRTSAIMTDKKPDANAQPLAAVQPEISPLPHAPINLTMSTDAKLVFEPVANLA